MKKFGSSYSSIGIKLFVFALSVVGLLWPALLQKAPIVVFDSVDNLAVPFARGFSNFSRMIYPRFLWLSTFGGSLSIFSALTAQALLVMAPLYVLLKQTRPRINLLRDFLIINLGLCTLSTLPWYLSQISPDFISLVCGLAGFVVIEHWSKLSTIEKIAIAITFLFSAIAHPSNPPILGLALIGYLISNITVFKKNGKALIKPTLVFLAVILMISAAQSLLEKTRPIRQSPVFLLSRMIYSGRISQTPHPTL